MAKSKRRKYKSEELDSTSSLPSPFSLEENHNPPPEFKVGDVVVYYNMLFYVYAIRPTGRLSLTALDYDKFEKSYTGISPYSCTKITNLELARLLYKTKPS